jgi:serine O-acetyltransferase
MTPETTSPGLWDLIREDWESHGRDWTLAGFRAMAFHRFGVWRMTVHPKILRAPLSMLYRYLYRKARNHYGIELPYTVQLGRRVIIEHNGAIIIHGHSKIGDECIIRQGVTIGIRSMDRVFDAPRLGKGVDIGAGAKILGDITIGDHVKIGANAVVLSDLPDGATAVGIPARIVTARTPAKASSE